MPKLGTHSHQVRRVLTKVLDAVTPSLRVIAREAGISYSAIRQYRKGQRTPSPEVLEALVDAIRKHSNRVAKLTDELEVSARRDSPTPPGRKP